MFVNVLLFVSSHDYDCDTSIIHHSSSLPILFLLLAGITKAKGELKAARQRSACHCCIGVFQLAIARAAWLPCSSATSLSARVISLSLPSPYVESNRVIASTSHV
jgi:hypothetical protein